MSGTTETKKARYESQKRLDKTRSKTRVCIGDAFERWRQLKAEKNLKTDAEMAHLLLDSHVEGGEVVMLECLLQLFYKCCNQCSINTKREGRFLYVRQRCLQCHSIRVWRSHPPDHINSSPAANLEAGKETVLSSFEDTESEGEEEVRGRNTLIQSCKGNIESKEIDGLHPLSSRDVEPVADSAHMTDKVNGSVILTPDALDSRSDDQEDVGRKDGCNSTHRSELEECEDENEDEEMENSDDDSSGGDDDDDADADWDPPAAGFKQLPASETDSTCSNADPDSETEVLLPLVWCCVCESGFKNDCFKQRHSRLYGCIRCGTKEHKQTEKDGEITEVTNNNQRTSSDHETSSGNNYNISEVGRQNNTCSSDQYIATGGNQDNGSTCRAAVFTSNKLQEISSNNGEGESTLGTMFIDNNDTTRNDPQEEASRNDERESDEENALSLHIEDLAATFESLADFKAHVVQCHGINQLRSLCTDCGKFITMVNMVDGGPRHICEHKVKPLVCPNCGKRFATELGLLVHVKRIHTEKYILTCRYCAKAFKLPKDKKEHEDSHQGQALKYHCPECPQRFPDRPSWRRHWKRHWPNGKHVCEICNKGFYNESSLMRHVMVHTGQKPYSCELCDRSFSQPGHLKSHMRVHTGEKPFMCHECGLCFNHNVSLKNHVQRYHGPGAEEKKGKGRGRRKKRKIEIT